MIFALVVASLVISFPFTPSSVLKASCKVSKAGEREMMCSSGSEDGEADYQRKSAAFTLSAEIFPALQ